MVTDASIAVSEPDRSARVDEKHTGLLPAVAFDPVLHVTARVGPQRFAKRPRPEVAPVAVEQAHRAMGVQAVVGQDLHRRTDEVMALAEVIDVVRTSATEQDDANAFFQPARESVGARGPRSRYIRCSRSA